MDVRRGAIIYNPRITMRNPIFSVTADRSPSKDRLRGIVSMIAAVFAFSIMDSLLKRVSSDYGPLQVACMRCLSSLVLLVCAITFQRGWPRVRAAQPLLHLGRGVLGIAMLACFVFAVHRLTMAQTYSLFMAAPLLMTALSVPMHGEVVTGRRWFAIAFGMSGVLIILHPWSRGLVSFAAAAAAAAATVCYSLSALTVRSLGQRNSSVAIIFWNFTLVGLGSGALAVFDWRPVPPAEWPWLGAIGIAGGLGQYWITDAFRRAPPAVVAPFEYTSILWAFAIDWIFWSASPSASLIAGAAVVVASGTYVIWDERRSADLALISASPPP
jgi:drug/metabolite transporter (DMT)-like permease